MRLICDSLAPSNSCPAIRECLWSGVYKYAGVEWEFVIRPLVDRSCHGQPGPILGIPARGLYSQPAVLPCAPSVVCAPAFPKHSKKFVYFFGDSRKSVQGGCVGSCPGKFLLSDRSCLWVLSDLCLLSTALSSISTPACLFDPVIGHRQRGVERRWAVSAQKAVDVVRVVICHL